MFICQCCCHEGNNNLFIALARLICPERLNDDETNKYVWFFDTDLLFVLFTLMSGAVINIH